MQAPRLGHRPGLTGLRGVAILMVVGFHVGKSRLPGAFVGVDLFFALSGFLITTLLLEEFRDTGRIDFGAFYRRRARRLLPALAVFIGVTALSLPFIPEGDRSSMVTAIASSALYVANFFAASGADMYYTHTWSLSLEEQFYVLWPLAVLGLCLLPRRRWLVAAPLAVLAACAIAAGVLFATGASGDLLYFGPLEHLQPLMAGCALAALFASGALPRERSWYRPAVAAGAVLSGLFLLWVAVEAAPEDPLTYRGLYLPISLACVLVLLAGIEAVPGVLARVLAWWPLQEAGRISYSLYLWHPLVMTRIEITSATRALAVTAISLVLAELSYRLVERPFLRLRVRSAHAVGDGPLKSPTRPLRA